MEKIKDFLTSGVALVAVIAHFGSIPLSFIYGDKLDVLISFFIPFYGVIVFLMN